MGSNKKLSKEEIIRYSRHLLLPEFGEEGQQKLKTARVLVVGAGGLGAPLLLYLTAAGVGTIGIVDFDIVELSNLQRQILFTEKDIGEPKVDQAISRLQELNPHITFVSHKEKLSSANALDILKNYDIVADGSDNFATRYLVNDACVLLHIPNVYGSIYRYEGQVSVFNLKDQYGEPGPNYRDLYPTPPPPALVPNCAEGGVLGVLAGIIGSLQASEVIKVLSQTGEALRGRLFIIDTLTFETQTVKFRKNTSGYEITKLIDYEEFCGTNNMVNIMVKEITVQELKKMKDRDAVYQLVDVRSPLEHQMANIGGDLMPLESLFDYADKINKEKQVVLYCKVGIRSMEAILRLQDKYNFTNLYNLKGGINAWATEIDTSFASKSL